VSPSPDESAATAPDSASPDAAGQAASGVPSPSYLDEIERLAGLRDQGILTDDEFQTRKQQLLNS
jgi:hypothetical protein